MSRELKTATGTQKAQRFITHPADMLKVQSATNMKDRPLNLHVQASASRADIKRLDYVA